MIRQKSGRIINLSSQGRFRGAADRICVLHDQSCHCASDQNALPLSGVNTASL